MCAKAASASKIPPFSEVLLHGLSQDELNGTKGTVTGYVASSGRRVVVLESGKELSIKPENLSEPGYLGDIPDRSQRGNDLAMLANAQDRFGIIALHEAVVAIREDLVVR